MKKKIIIIVSIVLVIIIGLSIWWFVPQKLCNIDEGRVEKITIFSGYTGKEIEITDEDDIKKLTDNFNSVKMKKDSVSFFTMGYMYRITIETDNGKKEFIVDSEYRIRGSVFGYTVTEGDNGYDYIDGMFAQF